MTWIVAFSVIFFIMILFLGATAFVSTSKLFDFSQVSIESGEYFPETLEIQRAIFSILSEEISYNNNYIEINDLIIAADGKNEEGKFLNEVLISQFTNKFGNTVYNYKLKKGEEIILERIDINYRSCFIEADNNLVLSIEIYDKEFLFCALKEFYGGIKNE